MMMQPNSQIYLAIGFILILAFALARGVVGMAMHNTTSDAGSRVLAYVFFSPLLAAGLLFILLALP